MRHLFLSLTLWSLILMTASASAETTAQNHKNPETLLLMETTKGSVVIRTFPDVAPGHVEQINTLAAQGFYDGIIWHRVIDGFMAQTGDPTGTGRGGSDMADLKAEFSDTNFGRGVIGMARSSSPNSANSQFFICFDDCSFLNGQYTVWGEVIEGMENIDKINRGEPPASPDKIISFKPAVMPVAATPEDSE